MSKLKIINIQHFYSFYFRSLIEVLQMKKKTTIYKHENQVKDKFFDYGQLEDFWSSSTLGLPPPCLGDGRSRCSADIKLPINGCFDVFLSLIILIDSVRNPLSYPKIVSLLMFIIITTMILQRKKLSSTLLYLASLFC